MLELNKIYNAEAIEFMSQLPDNSVDMILCDLPYGTTACKWDNIIPFDKLWEQYERIAKDNTAIVLTAQTPFDKVLGASNLKLLKYEWIWEKTQATGHLNAKKMPMKAHENILVFYKNIPTYNPQKTQGHKPINSGTRRLDATNNNYGTFTKELPFGGDTDRYPRTVLKFKSDKQTDYLHPTQKPLALLEYLIKTYTNEGDIVLDNCMGSGTTAVACKNTGRNFYGCELDEKYCEIANKRLKSVQGNLFGAVA